MVKMIAIEEVIDNGNVIGFKLKDENGKVGSIKTDAIIAAIKNNSVSIPNLIITNDNKLVMKKEENKVSENINTVTSKTVDSNEIKSENNTEVARIHELVDILNNARKVYEQGKDEVMDNFTYDKLYDELEQLEQKTGLILSNSPTQNVGYEVVSKLPKEKHETQMLSLSKTKDRQSLASWLNGRDGVLSWKMDGLTVVLTYDEGRLIKAVTRGNGEIGEVVTANAKQFKNVPRSIPFNGKLVLRGEAVIKYSDFEKINNSITNEEEKFKNPRNLCSGSVRQLDSKITASRNVYWYAFEIVNYNELNSGNNIDKQFKWLTLLGFNCVDYKVVNPNDIVNVIGDFEKKVKSNDIPSDGLVLTYLDKDYGMSLGKTAKSPRHSIAFKWQDETAITHVTGVEWSPSRTGLINPVVEFEPVDLEGSTIARASVHNVSIFLDFELGLGDRIEVYKANMIIPQVIENLDRSGTCEIPSTCPCCGEDTEIHKDPTSGVYTLWCPNASCPAKGNKLLEHFVSRDCMNIEGVSSSTLVALCDAGIITDFASIYHIKDHAMEVCALDGFGTVSFNNIVNAVEKSRDVKLANLICALGIPNIGLANAKVICKYFGYDVKKTVTAPYSQLIQIEGIGDVIAQSFSDYFNDHTNAVNFVNLLKELRITQETVSTNNSMHGVTICVTGDVYIFPNRRAVKDVVESLGGKLTGSVSKSTSYLVTNDTTSGSNKNKAAQAYGIPILSEQEFIDKFNIKI